MEISLSDGSNYGLRTFNVAYAKNSGYFDANNKVELDVKGLKKGYYYLKMVIGERIFSEKILVY